MNPYRIPAYGYDCCYPIPTPEGEKALEAVRELEIIFEHFGIEHETITAFADALLRAGLATVCYDEKSISKSKRI